MAASSHVRSTIRYDGPALVGHDMDVQDLAPALLALADIVQIANRKFNGDQVNMRVLVNADVDQKCFQLDLSLVQSLLDQAQAFFGKDNITTAATIAELIGLTTGAGASLFGLYKLLFGRKKPVPDGGISYTENLATGTTIVILGDGNTVEVTNQVASLASDPEVMKRVKTVLRPLEKPEYSDFSVFQGDVPVVRIDAEEAAGILAAPPPELSGPEEVPEGQETQATGPAWVDTSHFRGNAKWALLWNGVKIDAKMPDDFLERFQSNEIMVVPNTKLTVRMTITPKVDDNGNPLGPTSYVVTEVLKIELPPKAAVQTGMFDDHPEKGS